MRALSIERGKREVVALGGIGNIVRFWVGSEDVGAAVDLDHDEIVRVAEWLESWLNMQGETIMFVCNHQHTHRSPHDVEICNQTYRLLEAQTNTATYNMQQRNIAERKLEELRNLIRTIMQEGQS